AFERRIAAGAGGRAHIGRELRPQVLDQQIDAKLGHPRRLRRRCRRPRGLFRDRGEMLGEIGVRGANGGPRHKFGECGGGPGGRGCYFGTEVKCLARSACGRGMTCTDTSSPIEVAASAPASVAAFTAPTSPLMMTATSPSPTCSRPTIVTLAAFTMASAAASA